MQIEPTAAGTSTGTTTYSSDSSMSAAPTGDQPDYKALYTQALSEAAEWKNRFNGLQGTYQREQAKWKGDVETLTTVKTSMESLTAEKAGIAAQLAEIQEKLGMAETEKTIKESQLERMQIVMTEFPELTPFLAKGLIPDETGNELRQKLTELSKTIGEIKTGSVEAFKSGGSPATPPKPKGEPSKADLQNQMLAAFRSNDMDAYNRLYNEILTQSGGPNG